MSTASRSSSRYHVPGASPRGMDHRGRGVALTIIALWATSLIVLLTRESLPPWPLAVGGVVVQTFLHTGLFITAHDAMHGTVVPHDRRLNGAIGSLAVILYASFSYSKLLREHRRHHHAPATAADPDFHDVGADDPFRWYLRFVRQYVTLWQVVVMAAIFNVAAHGLGVAELNLVVFWVLPSLLSTVQLFVFGTYLPHRSRPDGHRDRHNASSSNWPAWLSFLTCYHFGYHWEHHVSPNVPWWQLAGEHRRLRGQG